MTLWRHHDVMASWSYGIMTLWRHHDVMTPSWRYEVTVTMAVWHHHGVMTSSWLHVVMTSIMTSPWRYHDVTLMSLWRLCDVKTLWRHGLWPPPPLPWLLPHYSIIELLKGAKKSSLLISSITISIQANYETRYPPPAVFSSLKKGLWPQIQQSWNKVSTFFLKKAKKWGILKIFRKIYAFKKLFASPSRYSIRITLMSK